MKIKQRMKSFFQHLILKPQLKRLTAWEKSVVDRPGSLRGGGHSPIRFNIPLEGIKFKGDHPPLPGFPGSVPQILGSIMNIHKSVRDLDRNPTDGKKQIDAATLEALT